MKLLRNMYSLVLALAVVFTLNNCAHDEISPQDVELEKNTKDILAKKKMSSASGQAGLEIAYGEGWFNGYQSFSFHMTKDVDGNVSGSFQSNYNDSMNDDFDVNTHGVIECATFDGNRVVMAGSITKINGGAFWDWVIPGEQNYEVYFEVVDNGEGKNAEPDQFTDVYIFSFLPCNLDFGGYLNDISNGNIQVTNNEPETRMMSNKGNAPSAMGQGSFLFNGNERRFAFHALTMPDGTVQGGGVLTYTGGDQKIKFDIDCITFLNDHTAVMSGVQTYNKLEPYYEGNAIYFKVVDNGEGKKADPDLMTGMVVNFEYPVDCAESVDLLFFELEGGNIQVNP